MACQKTALSRLLMVEAEYIGASDAVKEAIRIRSLYARAMHGQTRHKHTEHCPYCHSRNTTTSRPPNPSRYSSTSHTTSQELEVPRAH